ncbi:MAG: RNA polymerase sigma factor [Jatrophihabitantaceae bacterium]
MNRADETGAIGDDSPAAFSNWVEPHWPAMAALARRLAIPDWEDVLQEALGSAWRKRTQFDPARGSARNWLLAITADQARKSKRRFRPIPVADAFDSAAPGSDKALELDLEQAIARLTPRQQLAVNLRYFLGLPIAELATVMACSEGTAKSTLADARRLIRANLGEDYR